MPSANYSELSGAPAECREDRPWGFEVVEVRVPYRGVNFSVITQERLIDPNWPQADYEMFASDAAYDRDVVGGLGYEGAREIQLLKDLRATASATRGNTAFYHPHAKPDIVRMASGARDLLNEITAIYENYRSPDGVRYLEKSRGEGRPQGYLSFPLSVADEDVVPMVDVSMYALMGGRTADREKIRAAWHKALLLLWCALYGRSYSLSYKGNREEWHRRHPTQGVEGQLTATPPTPPPGAPGGPTITTRPLDVDQEPGPGLPPDLPPMPPEPEPEPARIPKASKWMLGGSALLGLVAGGRMLYRRLTGSAAAASPAR